MLLNKIHNKFILSIVDKDEYYLFVDGILITSAIAGVISMTTYSILDFTQKPDFLRKYKINLHTNEPPDLKKFVKVRMRNLMRMLEYYKKFNCRFSSSQSLAEY